jgi:flagellar hook-length control protein FliK
LQATAVIPTPIPPIVANNGGTGANAGAGSQQTNAIGASGSNPTLGLSALNPQKSSSGTTSLDDADDADGSDDGDASVSNIATDNSALLQSLGDSTQALAGALPAGGHLSQALAGASSATSTPTQSAPDLAALHGVFDATGLTASSGSTTTSGHSLAVDTPVGASGFAKELGQQVTWLSGQEVKQAQIRLNPQDLGPLDVKVSVEHGRVDVAFMTQHPAAAAAVQQGLGQLNQMLSGQGLSLGHTSVGQHGAQQQFADSQGQSSQAQTSGDSEDKTDPSSVSTLQRVAVGLVDAFA